MLEDFANGLAVITIDRPKALNAANVKMVSELREALAACRKNAATKAILLRGAGEKGFCSGGDVKALHSLLVADASSEVPDEQMYQEYNAVYELRQMKVPSVSLLHGITMGFGLGLGVGATYRVATEKSRLAMPENNIGLFPDAGFSYVAANLLPKGLGRLLALTGCHLVGAGDVIAAKLATHYMPFDKLAAFTESLKDADLGSGADAAIQVCLEQHVEAAPAPKLLAEGQALPGKFGGAGSLADVEELLKEESGTNAWAADLLSGMRKGAPFSQAVVFYLLQLAEKDAAAGIPEPMRLGAALERDFAAASHVMYRPDFVEGLRAVLVDKDMSAKWAPDTPAEVAQEEVTAVICPPARNEKRTLGLPVPEASKLGRANCGCLVN